jgi:hypothetical protein
MREGPMAPQMMLALKKTRPLGQVKFCGWSSVQMPLTLANAHRSYEVSSVG